MTVWATRADQVDLRGPNPHDLARSPFSRPWSSGCCTGGCPGGGDLGGVGGRLVGAVELPAAIVRGDRFDETEPVPLVDGGTGDVQPGRELTSGDQLLVAAGGGTPGGDDLGGCGAWLAGRVEHTVVF